MHITYQHVLFCIPNLNFITFMQVILPLLAPKAPKKSEWIFSVSLWSSSLMHFPFLIKSHFPLQLFSDLTFPQNAIWPWHTPQSFLPFSLPTKSLCSVFYSVSQASFYWCSVGPNGPEQDSVWMTLLSSLSFVFQEFFIFRTLKICDSTD